MHICRICLDSNVERDMVELPNHINNRLKNTESASFEQVVYFCLNIQVSKDSETKMCTNCFDSIISFYEFKSQALKNDKYFQTLIKSEDVPSMKVKTEIDFDNAYTDYEFLETDVSINVADNFIEGMLSNTWEGGENMHLMEEYTTHKPLGQLGDNGEAVKQKLSKRSNRRDKLSSKITSESEISDSKRNFASNNPSDTQSATFPFNQRQIAKPTNLKQTLRTKYPCNKCNKYVICVTRHMRQVHALALSPDKCGHCVAVTVPRLRCDSCPRAFRKRHRLDLHVQSAHGIDSMECRQCDKKFARYSSWQEHRTIHTSTEDQKESQENSDQWKEGETEEGTNREKCDVCLKFYANLPSHKKNMHYRESLEYSCSYCTRRFQYPSALASHERTHTNERPFACEHCSNTFRTKGLLSNHILSVHEAVKPKKCHICNKGFFQKYHLERHILTHEKDPESRGQRCKCDICNEGFTSRLAILKHYREVHNENKIKHIQTQCDLCLNYYTNLSSHKNNMHYQDSLQFACAHCPRRFQHARVCASHERTHTNERPFACALCDKRFRIKTLLNMHVQAVHEKVKKFICQICSKGFFKKYHLEKHFLIHGSERPHECPDCGRKFKSSETLRVHRTVHSGRRPFPCELCGRCFRNKMLLKSHQRSHTSEQPYQCRFCNERYKRSDYRLHHEKTQHLSLFKECEKSKRAP